MVRKKRGGIVLLRGEIMIMSCCKNRAVLTTGTFEELSDELSNIVAALLDREQMTGQEIVAAVEAGVRLLMNNREVGMN